MSGSDVSATWMRARHLAGVELLTCAADPRPWRWFHETYSFCACKSAGAGWRYRGGNYFLNDGSVMLLEPGEMHCNTVVHKAANFKVVLVSPDAFGALTYELGIPATAHFRAAQVDGSGLFPAIWRLGRAIEANATPLAQQVLLAQAVRVLADHGERAPRPTPGTGEPRAIALAKSYLEEKCREPITLDELSAVAGINRFRLVQSFRKAVGMPPHAWQLLLRVQRSRPYLAQGMPVVSVATEFGFYDQAHFARHFKRIMRVTPGEYARVHASGTRVSAGSSTSSANTSPAWRRRGESKA
jgi:AraC-like DNA-binding protein